MFSGVIPAYRAATSPYPAADSGVALQRGAGAEAVGGASAGAREVASAIVWGGVVVGVKAGLEPGVGAGVAKDDGLGVGAQLRRIPA